jgi:hypothetical protein
VSVPILILDLTDKSAAEKGRNMRACVLGVMVWFALCAARMSLGAAMALRAAIDAAVALSA